MFPRIWTSLGFSIFIQRHDSLFKAASSGEMGCNSLGVFAGLHGKGLNFLGIT